MNLQPNSWNLWKISLSVSALLSAFCITNAAFFPNLYPKLKLEARSKKDAGDPLLLTPYLKKGAISLAQNLSRVSITDTIGFRSHAGYFTIDEKYNSNLYFWYFPPFSKKEEAPVVLWLQGGPGGSSLFGLFTELGPLLAKKEGFALRKYHWALNYHLIFIDNPVGTGFSFTESENAYCTNEDCVARGLYGAMKQFFQMFPHLKGNDFYITGESYAGKYIPSLAMVIHQENAKSSEKIHLKGMAIGNGYCDPKNQLDYGHYLYQLGLIDDNQLKIFLKYQDEIANRIDQKDWVQADILMDRLMDGELTNFSYFKYFTGYEYYYNYLQTSATDDMIVFTELLQKDNVRRSVHVGGRPFDDGQHVQLLLASDMLQTVAPKIEKLLSHYRIMFYNGQLDIVVAYPLTVNFLHKLKFSASEEYKNARREVWKVGDDVAGYVKKAGNLTEVLIRNSGHMVPQDQPKWALNMITRFIDNTFDFPVIF
ncbi:venom serine carboxypeptidase [Helicoverpa armigera]|uniref:venom serine carboxypeptidase n=1 Tax=Helicoverpa armigera TaxID=29058 RepID=UPI000B367B37|nr:venom serine carboxypeptidase-like [Helicoverpa armigera]